MSEPPRARTPYRLRRGPPPWRTFVGWITAISGVLLFVFGYVASGAGIEIPFDEHHILTQVAGLSLAVLGLAWATRRPQR